MDPEADVSDWSYIDERRDKDKKARPEDRKFKEAAMQAHD